MAIKNYFASFLLLISISCAIQAQDSTLIKKSEFFPFSVWYSGGKARTPMLSQIDQHSETEWRHDLQQIKALGFNTVRTWVTWAACEPEKGKYNFENLHLLMKLAQEAGLYVFIQVYADSAPEWVAREFPHASFETRNRINVYTHPAQHACTDNEEVRDAVLRFYTEAATTASSYPNLFGWDLWEDPHKINPTHPDYLPDAQFCLCNGTKTRFRWWLMDKYQSLGALNIAWHKNFADWNEVDPPGPVTIFSYTDFIDWKTFIYEKLADDMSMRYEAIRKEDTQSLITAHTTKASLFESHPGARAADDFLMARSLDYYGVSLYPKSNPTTTPWSVTTLRTVMDFTRSANRENGGWYVGELQAGTGTAALLVGDPVVPDDHRIWAWSAIAKGAKGINMFAYYPMSSGYETGGYGLINLDGTITDRAVHAGEIARIVDKNQELFLASTPVRAEVGIVYNPLTQMAGGMQRGDYPGAHTNSLIGYFRAFADHNVPVDFIHRKHVESQELSQYKLIIIPWPVMITRETAEGIKEFVNNGGFVLAEARIGWNDERGYAPEIIPGLGLHEVFGVREHEVRMQESVNMGITSHKHAATLNLHRGDSLKGSLFAESLVPVENSNADILAKLNDGSAVLVSNRYGEGEAMLVGSYPGMANHPEPDLINETFFMNLLNWAQVKRPFTSTHDGNKKSQVEVRLQTNDKGYVMYVINHSATVENVNITLTTAENGNFRVRDIIMDQERRIRARDNILRLNATIDSKQVIAWEIWHN